MVCDHISGCTARAFALCFLSFMTQKCYFLPLRSHTGAKVEENNLIHCNTKESEVEH